MAARLVVPVCAAFPETALRLRHLLARNAKRRPETAPRKGHAIDLGPLLAYLAPILGCPADPADVTLAQFSHGQSNPTFTLRWAAGAAVVRKQPGGDLLKGAHDVRRERVAPRPPSQKEPPP